MMMCVFPTVEFVSFMKQTIVNITTNRDITYFYVKLLDENHLVCCIITWWNGCLPYAKLAHQWNYGKEYAKVLHIISINESSTKDFKTTISHVDKAQTISTTHEKFF